MTTSSESTLETTTPAAEAAPPMFFQGVEEPAVPSAEAASEARASGLSATDLDAVGARLAGGVAPIERRLQQLEQTVELKVSREEHLNQVIDQLHREVQDHRIGMLRKLLEPMVLDLLAMSDDFEVLADRDRAKADDPAAQARADLAGDFCDELREILDRYGFESYVQPDDRFDGTRQRAIRFESTGDRGLEGRVAERRRRGIVCNGQVLRPEQVVIYKFSPELAPPAEAAPEEPAPEATPVSDGA